MTHLRQALRAWKRTPAVAAVIVLTLALGIGATTTAFTLTYSLLLRPFPFPHPDRLVWITTYDTRTPDDGRLVINTNRMPLFAGWVGQLASFERVAAWNAATRPDVYTVTGAGMPERVNGLRVTQELFPMLDAQPAAGTLFRAGDDRPGAAQTVVLSQGYWERRFGSRPDIVGQQLTIENVPHTVVGVVSADFPLPGSLFAAAPIDVYLPLAIDPDQDIGGFMAVLARLRPGGTIDQARAELAARHTALATGRWQWMTVLAQRITPLPELVTRDARSPVLLLFAGVGCVLLIACVNLANLLLVRASSRRREMLVRSALGATRKQVFAQTLRESAVLTVAGGVGGLALAVALTGVVRSAPWISLVRAGDLRVDIPAVVFAFALCAVAMLIFGALPLLHLRRRDVMDALRPTAGVTPDRRAASVQRFAIAGQVAFALILTTAGALLLRSFSALLDVDPGFTPRGAIAVRVDPAGRLPAPARLPFFNRLVEEVTAVPGVESAALAINLPMDRNMGWDALTPGRPPNPQTDSAFGRIVSPGYFRTAGIQLIAGRDFNAADLPASPRVLAINQTFARRLSAEGRQPLGSRFIVLGSEREVVAVVADVRHQSLDRDAGQEMYIPNSQAPGFFQSFDLVVRAAEPTALVPALREAIWRVDRNQAIGTPVELQQLIDRTLSSRRLLTWLLGVFAAIAILLTGLGVYGVVGYRVTQRTKEIAIRSALGAPRWRLTTTVLRDTLAFVGLGMIAGVPPALASGGAVRAYLFGIEPSDFATLVVAGTAVIAVAFAAAYLPARRAPRVDPMRALRAE
jgi:putative ABC transport system permease protein